MEDDIKIKPNHSTAYGGMLLSALLAVAGLFITSEADSLLWQDFGRLLIVVAIVGVFIMIGAIAVVEAIYKKF